MQLDFNDERPIYLQLAEVIEDAILRGIFQEETQIISTTEISVKYKINPATAGKGVNILVDEGVLYKKRGLGMFVSSGAKERILKKRRDSFRLRFILPLMDEASKLSITKEEIIAMIEGSKGE
ncbi:MAG TPA: GntR family transcriptional regulator [Clostridia bacterium]|nr:GntR family transcriptional regulator [Clostridiales bacterium]HZX46654.1 GntR family transcriptional regulator [Clostridia bacterium]